MTTNRIIALALLGFSVLNLPLSTTFAQGTAFNYNGHLSVSGSPATGLFEFRFILYNAEIGGSQAGNVLTNAPVGVTNGVFTTTLDFGPGVFDGRALWVELAVRPSGSVVLFNPLAPRQPMLPTPYAITASNLTGTLPTAQLSGQLPATQLSGTVPEARLSANVSLLGPNIESAEITDGSITLVDLNVASFNTTFWRTAGNLGTDPSLHFLGTTDFQSLELHVGGQRALRLQPHVSGSANLIGGYSGNTVAPGRGGATIAGGGTPGQVNQVQYDFGTVSGGKGNDAGGEADTIGGGDRNRIGLDGFDNTIAGGLLNEIGSNTTASAIGGGWDNNISSGSFYSTIAGGADNNVSSNALWSAIGGGSGNQTTNSYATVPGGYQNRAGGAYSFAAGRQAKADHTGAFLWADSTAADFPSAANNEFAVRAAGGARFATLGAGMTLDGQPVLTATSTNEVSLSNSNNDVAGRFTGAFTGNGAGLTNLNAWRPNGNAGTTPGANFLGTTDNQPLELKVNNIRALRLEPTLGVPNFIAGDASNAIGAGVQAATIGGGQNNVIAANSSHATIAGGNLNDIGVSAPWSAIGGGQNNNIGANAVFSTIAGGYFNDIFVNADFSAIGGGRDNNIGAETLYATVAGGYQNNIGAACSWSTIGGGDGNSIASNSFRATITGGNLNAIGVDADSSAIGGGEGNDIGVGSRYATIAGGRNNTIRTNALRSAIGGGEANRIADESRLATIAGGFNNDIGLYADGSAIGGGDNNNIAGFSFSATIAGGHDNNVASNSPNATIAGGWLNFIGIDSASATIAGGERNNIGGMFGAIGGGLDNNIFNTASNATIAGGSANDIAPRSSFSTIGGGQNNNILSDSEYTTIAGGRLNDIGSLCRDSAIGGGFDNSIADNSDASTITGGRANNINSGLATIGGGQNNSIGNGALLSVIPGGGDNSVANGAQLAFAAGFRARANHTGSFVWADSSGPTFSSTVPNGFFVRSVGGVKFVTGIDGSGNEAAGLRLVAGSSAWTTLSDRNSKENVAPVDARALLERLVRIPIHTWNWKAQDDAIRHIGPMAQDFHAAFNVGEDDKHISTVDADGVALAAIQGLNQKLEDQRAELKQKQTEIAELKQRLERLEQLISQRVRGGER